MTTTAERLRSFWGERSADRDGLTAFAVRYWQAALMITIIGLAAGLRLWGLGDRAIHHDESIHIKFAWDITQFGIDQYKHDPVYHGPFQYFAIATSFTIFGDSEYTSRLAAALFGILLVGLPFLLRRQLGTVGSFLAAGLLAVSPVVLYVSRFAREDMYTLVFALGMVICIWRYVSERPADEEDSSLPRSGEAFQAQLDGFFNHITQRHNLWLIAIGPLMALSFATKEITPITVAILLIFLNFMVAWDLIDQVRASRKMSPADGVLAYVSLVLTAWLIVALWPFIGGFRKRLSLTRMPAAGPLLIVFGTLGAPQYSAAIQQFPGFSDNGYMQEPTLMHVTVLALILGGAYVGLMWNWRVWLAAAILFYLPFVLLFTSFFNNNAGFWTGIWGSTDYWLSQQHVRRGSQPDYYYFMLAPVYEFLPLIFALGGTLYYAFRGRLEQKLLAASALLLTLVFSIIPGDTKFFGPMHIQLAFVTAIATVLLISMDTFTKFLIYWALAILFALTTAGEKMPWLTVHLALPLALLAAKVIDSALASFPAKAARAKDSRAEPALRQKPAADANALANPWVLLGATAVLALLAALIFQAYGPASGLSVVAWVMALAAAGIVLLLANRVSLQAAGQVAVVGLFAALIVFTVRAAGNAAFDQGDIDGYPQEMLIYAQGSPKLGVIAHEIDRVAELSGLGYDLKIYIDNSGDRNIWPLPWYMRHYRNVTYTTYEGVTPEPGSVVLISSTNQGLLGPYLDQFQDPIPYVHMWWFPEFYRGLNTKDFLGDVIGGHYWSTWRAYFFDRTVPGVSAGTDMFAYFPKDFPVRVPTDSNVPFSATGQPLPPESVDVIAAHGTGAGEVNSPADVALDGDGNAYIVDTLNHRIVKLEPDGTSTSFGETGSGPGQFGDPFSDEYQNHDGPWGIAVDQDGTIYVADTWNHRIQKFDAQFRFLAEWGSGQLFGPRDIAIAADGNVLVVDTGNKRIVKYDPAGGLIATYGGEGSGSGQFNEPSSISVAPNGDIYVADYWNQRIQRFNANFDFLDEIRVPSWGSHGITDRAYIVALADGRVLATDPANARIAVLSSAGEEEGSWRIADTGAASRPIGITVDGDEEVYIADAVATGGQALGPDVPSGAVVRVPLSALLAPRDIASTGTP